MRPQPLAVRSISAQAHAIRIDGLRRKHNGFEKGRVVPMGCEAQNKQIPQSWHVHDV